MSHCGKAFFKIERNIPVPPKRKRGVHNAKKLAVPWMQMEVGDSVFIPDEKRYSVAKLVEQAHARLDRRFIVRGVDGGVRIWRTE